MARRLIRLNRPHEKQGKSFRYFSGRGRETIYFDFEIKSKLCHEKTYLAGQTAKVQLNSPMSNMAKIFRYHPGINSQTNNFAFEVKVILGLESTIPDGWLAGWPVDGEADKLGLSCAKLRVQLSKDKVMVFQELENGPHFFPQASEK